jgi:hypothetical protein
MEIVPTDRRISGGQEERRRRGGDRKRGILAVSEMKMSFPGKSRLAAYASLAG